MNIEVASTPDCFRVPRLGESANAFLVAGSTQTTVEMHVVALMSLVVQADTVCAPIQAMRQGTSSNTSWGYFKDCYGGLYLDRSGHPVVDLSNNMVVNFTSP